MSGNDSRLLDLARRLLGGEAIDWETEGIAESEVREGVKRLEEIVGRPLGRETETTDEPPPPAKAREVVSRSVSIFDGNGLGRTPAVLGGLVTRVQIDETEGLLSAAEASLREAIEIVTSSLGHDSPFQIEPIDLLVRVMRKSGRASEAEALERRAVELRTRSGQVTSLPIGASVPQSRIE